ncbi:group II intron maturase-specific domain-containing protein [Wolbachia endosymbiont of Cantharis cryptica]|uniref:group II intron maturase-specific domain-containing protein n=1 Tax=Wolbachia endosymbiont of Cantharis cryptica TaxID=3066132 RepID=UPI00376ECCF2
MRKAIEKRLAQCRLELHPNKTQIVYCKDDSRQGKAPIESFDFLGYTFRPRLAKNNRIGTYFVSFLPAISNKAKKKICQVIRSWRIHRQTSTTLEEILKKVNPIVRGWCQYYGRFYVSKVYKLLRNVELHLVKWVRKKYRKLQGSAQLARNFLAKVKERSPNIFYHWTPGLGLRD